MVHKKKDVGNQSSAYPTNQAFALPLRKDKQRQLAHACMLYRDMTAQTSPNGFCSHRTLVYRHTTWTPLLQLSPSE